MRAIVVLFNGDFLSEAHEKDLIGTFMSMVAQCTNAEGQAKVVSFTYEDIAKLFVEEAVQKKVKRNSDFEEELIAYCRTVLRRTPIISTDTDQEKKLIFIKGFFSDSKLREPKRVLHWLKNCENPSAKCQSILDSNGLSNLPLWIKEIMSVTNIL